MRTLTLALLALSGCAAPSGVAEPLPVGSWSGTVVREGGPRGLPSSLVVRADGVELLIGGTRLASDEASFRDGRLRFRAPGFRSGVGARTLRCDLLQDDRGGLGGSCRAGTDQYRLALSQRPF